jgi:hypothetical protein
MYGMSKKDNSCEISIFFILEKSFVKIEKTR